MTSPLPPRQSSSERDVVDLRCLGVDLEAVETAGEWPESTDRPELAALLDWLEQPEASEPA